MDDLFHATEYFAGSTNHGTLLSNQEWGKVKVVLPKDSGEIEFHETFT